jgi:hypothetical protein
MSTPVLKLNDWQEEKESMDEHILRVAAAYIRSHGKDCNILFGLPSDTDTMNPGEFADYLDEQADSLNQDRIELMKEKNTTMEFIGTIIQVIQAGGESNPPTVTLATTKEQLKAQKNIPFFQSARIRITPIS